MSQNTDLEPAKTNLDCEAVEQLIGAYSMGLTSPDETAFIEAHLADCPEAGAELAQYQILTQKLLFSAPLAKAPAHLHTQLRATISTTRALLAPLPHVPFSTRAIRRLKPLFSSRANFALLAITLLLLIVTNGYWVARLSGLQQQVTAHFLDYNAALALLGAEGTQRFVLTGEAGDVHADMLCNPDKQLGLLYTEDLPQLPADRSYQVWLIQADQHFSVGVFQVDEDGASVVIFRASQPLKNFDAVTVTQEREGGNPQPTTPAIMAAKISYELTSNNFHIPQAVK